MSDNERVEELESLREWVIRELVKLENRHERWLTYLAVDAEITRRLYAIGASPRPALGTAAPKETPDE